MEFGTFIAACRGQLVILEGGNFSGRTHLLRHCFADPGGGDHPSIYIGASVQRYLSSLMPDVYGELYLHFSGARHENTLFHLAESLGLIHCFRQSPFSLSGGEQILVAILSKLALEPTLLALDSTLAELDQINRIQIAQILCSSAAAENTTTVLTENGYAGDRVDNLSIRQPVGEFVTTSRPRPRFCASEFRFIPSTTGSLEVEEIYFGYEPQIPLLRGISFRLEPGRIYSLEGRNGAGKSTLAQILIGALVPLRGRIFFDGRLLTPWKNPGQITAMHTQNPDVQLFSNSIRKELADLPENSSAARLAGVENLMDEHPGDLPFVLRKRLTFSIVAHLKRPWFIFDEPTIGQDIQACDQMVAVLRKMARNGVGIIVISHSQEFIRRLETKRLWLEEGLIKELQ